MKAKARSQKPKLVASCYNPSKWVMKLGRHSPHLKGKTWQRLKGNGEVPDYWPHLEKNIY